MDVPHTLKYDWGRLAVPADRLAARIATEPSGGCQIALLGLPDDTGVLLNGGRSGARRGPGAFRAALSKVANAFDAITGLNLADVGIYDAGDVVPPERSGDDVRDMIGMHDRVTEAVEVLARAGMITVCIGGGHDLTYAAVRGHFRRLESGKRMGGVNIDAHLDLRETPGSGMAFRRIIEESGPSGLGIMPAGRFAEIGLGRFSNAREHLEYARLAGVTLVFRDRSPDPMLLTALFDHLAGGPRDEFFFASFDLDSVDSAYAPGVSAMNWHGLAPATAMQMCELLGRNTKVRHFDIMELSPPNDHPVHSGRSARLAASLFVSFVAGVALRRSET